MALGGGTFISMNKTLPGAYINFVSSTGQSVTGVDRGVVAMAMDLDWGPDGEVFRVSQAEFYQDPWKYFGHAGSDAEMKPLRDLFLHASAAYLYKTNSGGAKAQNTFATAKYSGTAGNDLMIVVQHNESHTEDDPLFDVYTYANGSAVDSQTVSTMAGLENNDFVDWKSGATLAVNAGLALTGGTNGTSSAANHQLFLDAIQNYSFNVMGCYSADATVQALYVAFVQRMRDQMGVKFQLVVHAYASAANYEGVINVKNNTGIDLVPWVCGAEAACPINQSISNMTYDGEYDVSANYTQTQLESALAAGEFVFHRVGDGFRVLQDINTLVTFTAVKNDIFRDNQTIRIIDYIGNYTATLFDTNYYGMVINDAAGRTALWGDLVKMMTNLQTLGAILDFDSEDVAVSAGAEKGAVVVEMAITVAGTMTKLYMTVLVN